MTNHDPVWIDCQEPGCPNGIGVHWRHVHNFEGRFYCPDHETDEVAC